MRATARGYFDDIVLLDSTPVERRSVETSRRSDLGSPARITTAAATHAGTIRKLAPAAHDPWEFWKAFNTLILAFRRDLGHADDADLEPYDLVRLFIDDVDAQIARDAQRLAANP